jgi:hypothetical protein
MAKDSLKNKFNKEVEKFHDRLISYVRGSIFEFKRNHGLNDEEISDILSIDEEMLSDFMHETWDGYVDSRLLSILFLLSDGKFDFSKVIYKKPDDFTDVIKAYIDEFSVNRHERNIAELLNLLGIENDVDLKATVLAIKEILKDKRNGKEEDY